MDININKLVLTQNNKKMRSFYGCFSVGLIFRLLVRCVWLLHIPGAYQAVATRQLLLGQSW